MFIACLGWGSLVWRRGGLPTRGEWFCDGPELPLEFARQSGNKCITLVIVEEQGVPLVRAFWVLLSVPDARSARAALGQRERIPAENWERDVGLWIGGPGQSENEQRISKWARRLRLDAVVWTALPPKFGLQQRHPSQQEVLDYLDGLRDVVRDTAEEYVRKAPAQIDTPYRRAIADRLGWTPIPAVEQPPDEPQIPLPPGQDFRRIEVVDAIDEERALAVAPYCFTVAQVGQFGPITKVTVEPVDDRRPVDEALEGRTAQWHGGHANVLSVVPKESVLHLRFVAGGQPLQGNALSVRPADYLEKLAIEWRTNSAAAGALAWLDQHNGDAAPPGPVLDPTNFPHLRHQQRNAFTLTGRTRGFLWGPPGTGKTTTLGCLLAEYALSHPNHRALLIACSNTAVDHSILAVDKALDDLLRVGLAVGETRHACKRIGLHFDADRFVERTYLLPEIPDELVQRLSEVEARRPDPANPQAYYRWKLAYEEVQSEIRAVLRKDLFATRVAAMTATRAIYTISELRLLDYDLVVFDEASQLGLAQSAMLAPLGKRVLFAGDPKQLAPIVQAEHFPAALHWLGESAFSLQNPDTGSMCFLDEQNRMAEPICRVVSELFYGGRLRVAEEAVQDAEWIERHTPADAAGLGQANVHVRTIEQEGLPANPGWYRPLSCEFICQTVACLVHRQDPSSILVLTPFRGQRQNIRTRLLQLGVHGVDVSTVHRAQGSERHTGVLRPCSRRAPGCFRGLRGAAYQCCAKPRSD